MAILSEEFVIFPIVALIAFGIAYFSADNFLAWLHEKSLGNREHVLKRMEMMFIKTDVKRVTWTMVALSFGPGLIIWFLLLPNVIIGSILAGVVIVLGWQVPRLVIDNLYESRCQKFANQMVDGLTILSNGVKSGLTVQNSMERVVENMTGPIRQEFKLVLAQIQLGLSIEDAFNNLAERVPKADVQMFVMAVNILGETGGDMSETFQTIVETIRDRQKVQRKIEAMTAQGVFQGIVITLLPFGLMAMFWLTDRDFIMPMFTSPLGWALLFVMLVLQLVGGLLIRKIVKIEV